jgi:hypothetical protein
MDTVLLASTTFDDTVSRVRQQVVIDGGDDDDIVQLDVTSLISSKAAIQIFVSGGLGCNSLAIHGSNVNDYMTVTSSEINGASSGHSYGINWNSFQSLNVSTYDGDDIVNVLSTAHTNTQITGTHHCL